MRQRAGLHKPRLPRCPLTAHTRPTTVLDNTSDNPGRVRAGLGYWASGPACIRSNSTRAPRWDAEPVWAATHSSASSLSRDPRLLHAQRGCWQVQSLSKGRHSLRDWAQQRWDGEDEQLQNQWLRRLRQKTHHIYSLTKELVSMACLVQKKIKCGLTYSLGCKMKITA